MGGEKQCGTTTMYGLGCRCRPCKDAQSAWQRWYRGKRLGRYILSRPEKKMYKAARLLILWAWLFRRAQKRAYNQSVPKETKARWMRTYRERVSGGQKHRPGPRHVDWGRYEHLLGKHADSHVAREAGVGVSAVAYARRARGIPPLHKRGP